MWKRFWSYIKSLMSGGLDKLESPEPLLAQAQAEMREQQARNRVRAVQAVTARNHLQKQIRDTRERVAVLTAKASEAEARGDTEAAQKLRREISAYEAALAATQKDLEYAVAVSEQAKKAIQSEEEAIRRKTAEALSLKTQWENSHIYSQMQRDLRNVAGQTTNRAGDPGLRWLLATYGFILLLLLLVLLIVRASR